MTVTRSTPVPDPFDPGQVQAYRRWRDAFLDTFCGRSPDRVIDIGDLGAPSGGELGQLKLALDGQGFAFYRAGHPVGPETLVQFARALGLRRCDPGIGGQSEVRQLRDLDGEPSEGAEYIPFTRRALNWHTDGYYNELTTPVRSFIMHCVNPAARGGENQFLDPRRVYVALRDEDPGFIEALGRPEALTIPANIVSGEVQRPARSGPVFSSLSGPTPALGMRYTIRKRHVNWDESPAVTKARQRLRELLESDVLGATRKCLQAGEGVVCANVLHTRAKFDDEADRRRLMLRARYIDPISL